MTGRLSAVLQFAEMAAILLVACFSAPVSARGQDNPPASPAPAFKPPAFDVISVKPSQPDCPGMSVSWVPGRFSAHCTTLLGTIYNAFPIKPNTPVPGLPNWANSDLFDIDAKINDESDAALQKLPREEQWNQTKLMVQSLLADRFKLRTHYETKQGPIYSLILAKGGFKLKEAPDSEPPGGYSWGSGNIKVTNGPIASLVLALSDALGRDVDDKTGLTGNYDIKLTWAPDEQQGTANAGPSLFTSIQEQIGLKLVSGKGPVRTFVVDHAERPSAN